MNESSLFHCLAAPARLDALKALAAAGELSVTDLTDHTGTEQTNLSHHLAQLRSCGLVATRQDGKRVMYRLATPRLGTILEMAGQLAAHIDCDEACGADCCGPGCC